MLTLKKNLKSALIPLFSQSLSALASEYLDLSNNNSRKGYIFKNYRIIIIEPKVYLVLIPKLLT